MLLLFPIALGTYKIKRTKNPVHVIVVEEFIRLNMDVENEKSSWLCLCVFVCIELINLGLGTTDSSFHLYFGVNIYLLLISLLAASHYSISCYYFTYIPFLEPAGRLTIKANAKMKWKCATSKYQCSKSIDAFVIWCAERSDSFAIVTEALKFTNVDDMIPKNELTSLEYRLVLIKKIIVLNWYNSGKCFLSSIVHSIFWYY